MATWGEDEESEEEEGSEGDANPLGEVFDAIEALTKVRMWATLKQVAKEACLEEGEARYYAHVWQKLNAVEVRAKGRKGKVRLSIGKV